MSQHRRHLSQRSAGTARRLCAAGLLLCAAAALLVPASPAGTPPPATGAFTLSSPDVGDGGALPKAYTGDGESATLPLAWRGAPAGTRSFALAMHHVDREGKVKWYWILYDIPADVAGLPRNVRGIGTLGTNSINGRTEYAPPHSKGPGAKTYTYTLFALSEPAPIAPSLAPDAVGLDALRTAMRGRILATAELRVVYTRPEGANGGGAPPPPLADENGENHG